MIDTNQLNEIIEAAVRGEGAFVVDTIIKPTNNIQLYIDKQEGLTIADCVKVSRKIEALLDRDVEDYELNVSSPGLDEPFKVVEQYIKNIGRKVEVLTIENQIITGELLKADDKGVEIQVTKKEKVNNKKQIITNIIHLNYNQIKKTKIVIIF